MRLLAMSDIHGRFEHSFGRFEPKEMPPADLVIVAGDITDFGMRNRREVEAARLWFERLAARYPGVFYLPGNHDIGCDNATWSQERVAGIMGKSIRWNPPGAGDSSGLTLHGVSLTVAYTMPILVHHWAYMTVDQAMEQAAFSFEPVDVVVSHGPPMGVLDHAGYDLETGEIVHIGSPELRAYIERNQPRLVICGHAHDNAPEARIGTTLVVNVAERWQLIEMPVGKSGFEAESI